MGQLLAEVAGMAIKKGMIEENLHEPTQERAAPLQPETSSPRRRSTAPSSPHSWGCPGLLAFNAAFLISGRRYWRVCPSGDLPTGSSILRRVIWKSQTKRIDCVGRLSERASVGSRHHPRPSGGH